eukprot:scaffold4247_cov66-Cylindrotheca_fusiformis.AAC.4
MQSLSKAKTAFEDLSMPSIPPPPSIEDSKQIRCALCFFGLPRSYKTMVLPSIERNVLPRNPDCDIFVHFFYQEEESAGRYNDGGKVDPNEILLLQNSIQKENDASSSRVIKFVNDTREVFFQKRQDQLWRYHEAYNRRGEQLYYPWKHKTWEKSSLDNMVMQWHSIEEAFHLMEEHANQNNIQYTRVAMLRNDVLFLTPIDIMQLDKHTVDSENERFVVPNFCKYPVNDRMIYGPYDAVKVWSTERFHLIEKRVQQQNQKAGTVMHSEYFMKESIFPAIKQQHGYEMHINPDICFIRTRAESIALTDDCTTEGVVRGFKKKNMQDLVEETIGRKCMSRLRNYNGNRRNIVDCSDNVWATSAPTKWLSVVSDSVETNKKSLTSYSYQQDNEGELEYGSK